MEKKTPQPAFFAAIALIFAALSAWLIPSELGILFGFLAIHGTVMTAARIVADEIAKKNNKV